MLYVKALKIFFWFEIEGGPTIEVLHKGPRNLTTSLSGGGSKMAAQVHDSLASTRCVDSTLHSKCCPLASNFEHVL